MSETRAGPIAAGTPSGTPAVVVRDLRKTYGSRAAVDGLSFEVARGELFAVLGPNGAGKTTTVEILEGYRRADGGEVHVLGLDPARDGAALRARLGLMLQQGGVYPQARPREILRLFARFYADPLDPDAVLELVGLADAATTRYKVLSGGQKQRLGLGLAIVGRPELVVLDEPTAGMDPHAKAATRELVATLRSTGVTVLLTTHELADVERLADRIAVIDRGRLVALGSAAELTGRTAPRLRVRFARPLEATDRAALEGALLDAAPGTRARTGRLAEDGAPGRYRLDGVAPDPRTVLLLAAWCAERGLLVEDVRTGGGTLEEAFLELTSGSATEAGEQAGSAENADTLREGPAAPAEPAPLTRSAADGDIAVGGAPRGGR
ncbi:MAG TPA: ABC transporter ATP-binding protein [Candidatus Limnocylindrales bacterium]